MKNPRFPAQAVLIEGTLQLTSYVPDTFGYACSSHQIVTTEIYQLLAKQNTKQKTRNGGGGGLACCQRCIQEHFVARSTRFIQSPTRTQSSRKKVGPQGGDAFFVVFCFL